MDAWMGYHRRSLLFFFFFLLNFISYLLATRVAWSEHFFKCVVSEASTTGGIAQLKLLFEQ